MTVTARFGWDEVSIKDACIGCLLHSLSLVQVDGKNANSHALLGKKKEREREPPKWSLSLQLAGIKHVAFEIRLSGQNLALFHHLWVFTLRKSYCVNVSSGHSQVVPVSWTHCWNSVGVRLWVCGSWREAVTQYRLQARRKGREFSMTAQCGRQVGIQSLQMKSQDFKS